jgi:aminoglycoside phosphotransferase (APT) family kinase protein
LTNSRHDGGVSELVPIASGRDADVFALDEHRVLRRYRKGGDVAREAAVMAHLAEAGYPVPAVYRASGTDLVMERIDGQTMLQALADGVAGTEEAAAVLAQLHQRLREVPAQRRRDPADRILHLDLHPGNVMLGPHGPVVIDWRNSREGPPDLDVAYSAVILAQIVVDGTHLPSREARALLAAFLRAAPGKPAGRLDEALARRRADRGLTAGEVGRLDSAAELIRRQVS